MLWFTIIMTGLALNVRNMEFIGLCLEGFLYGLYSAIFAMYLRHQTSENAVAKTWRTAILFHSLCLLYFLSVATFAMDIAMFILGLYDTSTENRIHMSRSPILSLISVVTMGCCDFIAQSVLIYRCWIVWGHNIYIVIIPSVLAFSFLAGWSAAAISLYVAIAAWEYPMVLACLVMTLTVNALVTGLIVFRIIRVYWETKPTLDELTLGRIYGSKLRTVIFVLIESGMILFSIQLTQLVLSVFWTNTAIKVDQPIMHIQQMLNGITPTIIQVRVSMGLSFHEEKSMAEFVSSLCFLSDHPNSISETGIVGSDDQLSSDIDVVEWYAQGEGAHGAGSCSKSSSSPTGCVIHTRPNVFKSQNLGLYFIKTMTLLTKNKNKNSTALNTGTTQPTDGAYDDRKFAPYPSQGQQLALSGPSHPGFNGGPPPGIVHNTTQPSQGQHGTKINQGQYPQPLGNPSHGAYTAAGHTQRVGHPADSPTNITTGCGGPSLQRTVGKVETAIGSMIGSNSLKVKGQQKEREANFKSIQAAEIAEAERLEKESLMRRGRAVDHGAHPAHSALGGPGGPRTK